MPSATDGLSVELEDAPDLATLLRSRLAGRSQRALAEEIGVPEVRLNRWLSGSVPTTPSIPLLARWAGVTDIEMADFLRDRHRRNPEPTTAERITALEAAVTRLSAQMDRLAELVVERTEGLGR